MISRAPAPPAPSDKIQITNAPPALPGNCVICGRTADGVTQFVDINWSLDYYGGVYFCVPCLIPLSHAIGFVDIQLLLDAERECVETKTELMSVADERDNYRRAVDSLRSVRPTLVDSDSSDGENQGQDDSGLEGRSETEGSDDSESTQQTPSRGFADIPFTQFNA